MEVLIEHGPGSASAKVQIAAGESFTAEAGAMIAMSPGVDIKTTTHKRGKGGLLKAAKRMLSGESFFLNHYTAPRGGEVYLSSSLAGDMMTYELTGEPLVVQAGSYVASEESVDMDMGWQGFKSLFSGESMFWLKLTGHGKVVLNSFGAIYSVPVEDELIVDTGHIVAFDENLRFAISKAGASWMSSILGGEGLVCKFSGRGTVWCQSHNSNSFGATLGPMLRARG